MGYSPWGHKRVRHNLVTNNNKLLVLKINVCSSDLEDPLEKEMTTHSSSLAWEIPQTEEPGALQSMGSQKSQTQLSD